MQTVSAIVKKLMCEEPYYGLFACGINKVFSDLVPTAAVGVDGINYMLYINEKFWKGLTEESKYGALKHELLHMCFFHVTDGHDLYEPICPDRRMLNIALDLEVESYVDEKYWVRNEKGELIGAADGLFKKFPTLEKRKGTKYYINFLKQLKDCTENQQCGQGTSGMTQTGSGDDRPDSKKKHKKITIIFLVKKKNN